MPTPNSFHRFENVIVARMDVPLSPIHVRVARQNMKSEQVHAGDSPGAAIRGTSIGHQHCEVRDTLRSSAEFVVRSLRHTMLTRLGEAGADAFTIMRIAGLSSVTFSQRYLHPTSEAMERAFERLENLNAPKFRQAKAEAKKEAAGTGWVPAKSHNTEKNVVRKPRK